MFILLNLPAILPAAQSGKDKTYPPHTHIIENIRTSYQTGGKSCAREGEILLMKYHLVCV